LDPITGGAKIGLLAYENSFIISKIATLTRISGEDQIAVAFSVEEKDVLGFMVVPRSEERVVRHEVDGTLGVVKTIDIAMRIPILNKGKTLPVAAVGTFVMDTSGLMKEVENLPAEGWRPKPTDLPLHLVSGNLAVARMNGSSLSFKVMAPIEGKYRAFIRYYDLPEGFTDKEVVVDINGEEIGRIKYEGSGFYLFWSRDIEMVKGANTITLTPLSKVSTSEFAYIDYFLAAPKLWEKQAIQELVHLMLELPVGS